MNLCVIIPAAGRGTRFGGGDKLSCDLGGRPVLLRTVECFTRREEVDSILVAGPPDDIDSFKDRYGAALGFHGVTIVPGGRSDRWETVQAALAEVPAEATHVAVHDAARPVVPDALLDRVFMASRRLPAVVPAIDLSSTIKRIDPANAIDAGEQDDALADSILGDAGRFTVEARPVLETAERSVLVAAQTPQVFERSLLERAYAAGGLEGVTDDAQAVERLGETVHVVPGDPANIKITTQGDLDLCSALLGTGARRPRPAENPFDS